jgi:hypothetical protein
LSLERDWVFLPVGEVADQQDSGRARLIEGETFFLI